MGDVTSAEEQGRTLRAGLQVEGRAAVGRHPVLFRGAVWSIRQLNEVGEADAKTQDTVKKLKVRALAPRPRVMGVVQLFRRFYMIELSFSSPSPPPHTLPSILPSFPTSSHAPRALAPVSFPFSLVLLLLASFLTALTFNLLLTRLDRLTWTCKVVEELATLCLFVWVGHAFRPTHNNPYLQIPSETEMQTNP
eukprot:755098-Hanusia_phi.AAC.2